MKKPRRYRITVEGSGVFPIDMLRYDQCWPRTEQDAAKASIDWAGEMRQVDLLSDHHRQTPDRWASFTWKIVKVEEVV